VTRDVFRDNLKYYRNKRGLTQEELSEACHYDRTYVGKIERGAKDPSVETMIRLANELDVPLQKFFREEATDTADSFYERVVSQGDDSTRLYRAVFQQITAKAALINPDGELLDVNQSFTSFSEKEADELIGTDFRDLAMWRNQDTEWVDPMIRKTFDNKKTMRQVDAILPDCGEVALQCNLSPLRLDEDIIEYGLVELHELDPGTNQTYVID
jgi:PAS domain S-box-containing protein